MASTCWHKITVTLSVFCLLISPLRLRAQPESKPDEVIPSITFNAVPLSDAIKNLARQAGFNYIINPHVPPDADVPPLTLILKNVSAGEAFDTVLKLRRLVRIDNPATSIMRIAPAKLGIKPISQEQFGKDTNAVVPVIMFDEVPLKDAVQVFANQLHLKITFDKKFMATPAGNSISSTYVSVRWKHLTLKQALVALLDNYELVMIPDQSGSSARITTKEEASKSKSP